MVDNCSHHQGNQEDHHVGQSETSIVVGFVVGLNGAGLDQLHKGKKEFVHEPQLQKEDAQSQDLPEVDVLWQTVAAGVED